LLSEKNQNLGNLKNIQNTLTALLSSLDNEIKEKTGSSIQKFPRGIHKMQELKEKLNKSQVKLQSFENLFSFFRDFEEKAMDLVTSKYLRPDLRIIEKEIKNFKHEHFSKLLKSPQVFTTQILTSFENLISVKR
jgi:hypothetical protein